MGLFRQVKGIEPWPKFKNRFTKVTGMDIDDIEIDVLFPDEDEPEGDVIIKRGNLLILKQGSQEPFGVVLL